MALFGQGDKKNEKKGPALAEKVRALTEAVRLSAGRVDEDVLSEAERVVKHVDRRLAFSGDVTVVALAGATGSGKATRFNALSGARLAEPGAKRPTTPKAMSATFGNIPTDALLDWLEIPRRHLVTGAPADLDGLVLLDLPDHDSTEVAHRQEVDRLVQLVDMLIWVVDPQKYADAALHDRYLKPLAQHADVMMVVLNQSDKLTPEQLERCLHDLRALLDSEGLGAAQLAHMSAFTGEGVPEVRAKLAQAIKDKKVAARRLEADVEKVAAAMAGEIGDAATDEVPRDNVTQLNQAFADAAGVPVVEEAVLKAWRHRGGLATGWPALAWLARFRPDPLRALHLDRLPTTRKKQELEPARVQRTSLPTMSGVQKARVDSAIRELADAAGGGLPRGWSNAVMAAARSNDKLLPDELDKAVATTDLALDRGNGWWTLIRVLQWLFIIVTLVGLVWLGIGFAALYFQFPPPPSVRWHNIPIPTLLVFGGVACGLLLAALSRVFVEVGARAKAGRARHVLTKAVGRVAHERVIDPVNAELARYDQARDAIKLAR